MNGKVFADSNVFLYLVRNEKDKKEKALEILNSKPVVSAQVLFTEDMQHKQVIEDKLTIINPFV